LKTAISKVVTLHSTLTCGAMVGVQQISAFALMPTEVHYLVFCAYNCIMVVGFGVWRIGVKGAGIYCSVKVLFFVEGSSLRVSRSIVVVMVICWDTMYPLWILGQTPT
jgi:hypothetical protein